MKISLLYFGRPRERLGLSQETVDAPETLVTLSELLAWLGTRGGRWTNELADKSIRCAINQTILPKDSKIQTGDEIAIFSPISGG